MREAEARERELLKPDERAEESLEWSEEAGELSEIFEEGRDSLDLSEEAEDFSETSDEVRELFMDPSKDASTYSDVGNNWDPSHEGKRHEAGWDPDEYWRRGRIVFPNNREARELEIARRCASITRSAKAAASSLQEESEEEQEESSSEVEEEIEVRQEAGGSLRDTMRCAGITRRARATAASRLDKSEGEEEELSSGVEEIETDQEAGEGRGDTMQCANMKAVSIVGEDFRGERGVCGSHPSECMERERRLILQDCEWDRVRPHIYRRAD
jgi:hypothetical protein